MLSLHVKVFMNYKVTHLLNFKTRIYIYLLSFTSLFFLQTYCSNVCSFIDGLSTYQIYRNLGFILILHLIYREVLYRYFDTPWKTLSLPRHTYFLSIISWFLAGISALLLHSLLYPDFPLGSHLKLLSSYFALGGGILAQIEYIIFENEFKKISSSQHFTLFNEKLARRIVETFVLFTFIPILVLLLTIGRYNLEGSIDTKVTYEMLFLGIFLLTCALILSFVFAKVLKEDTKILIDNIKKINSGNYLVSKVINRADELGEISYAIKDMGASINDGICQIESLSDEIIKTQKEIIYAMGTIAETRSKETGQHVRRVAEYSKYFALKLGLGEEEAEMLKLASPMHDVGKIGIPDSILNKPGKHTPEEFEIMKTHALLGYDMLKHSNKKILQTAAIVAKEHHEKYDGSGYPYGLKGEEIHIYGRITAVADVFDALGSDRVYKKAWEDERIFELFKEQKGKHFDPKIIDIFFENLEDIFVIRNRYKDTE